MLLIGKGAEAYVYSDGSRVRKVRKEKGYRHPELDAKLRKERTKREGTAIAKCNDAGICTPKLIRVDGYEIEMEHVDGKRLSEVFEVATMDEKREYAREMGRMLAKMHGIGLCHGDYALTNIIHRTDGRLCIIDFGLCEFSTYYEKKAADLAVMHSSLRNEEMFNAFVESYRTAYNDSAHVIGRFERNLTRGRYKERR